MWPKRPARGGGCKEPPAEGKDQAPGRSDDTTMGPSRTTTTCPKRAAMLDEPANATLAKSYPRLDLEKT